MNPSLYRGKASALRFAFRGCPKRFVQIKLPPVPFESLEELSGGAQNSFRFTNFKFQNRTEVFVFSDSKGSGDQFDLYRFFWPPPIIPETILKRIPLEGCDFVK